MADLTDEQLLAKIVRSLCDNSADFQRAARSNAQQQSPKITPDSETGSETELEKSARR